MSKPHPAVRPEDEEQPPVELPPLVPGGTDYFEKGAKPDREPQASPELPPLVPGGTDYFEKGAKPDRKHR